MLKRLCSALLTLALSLGLVTAFSGTASATNYQVIDWNISNITAGGNTHHQNYWNLIDAIHRYTYGDVTGVNNVTETTTERGRLVQVRVLDTNNTHLASVYLWANDLYVAGFYAPQTNTHWAFQDRINEFQTALGVTVPQNRRIASGNYSDIPGGNNRGSLAPAPENIYNAMRTLGRATAYNDATGRAVLMATQIFSEAARFGVVFDVVRGNIQNPNRNRTLNYVDPDPARGTVLAANVQNQWGAISQFIRNARANPSGQSVSVMGHTVTTIAAVLYYIGFIEANGGIMHSRP
ncbi:ribosome-inactivating family protein [Kitasatospora sp. NPDC089913]|uniref:ribosome-inactivating family protein n=1 Tax=Streptomycetaceae TaxID=2062 RepID=UPI00087C4676|nr:ribosome-inactivating family protein [Streptomyces sp. TLI_053]SDS66021.1 Ribosome inactivating protein [Streptomyces sp. TLI_053]